MERDQNEMPTIEKNSNFFLYLSKIGLLNKNHVKILQTQTQNNEIDDKNIIFEISEIFCSYTHLD